MGAGQVEELVGGRDFREVGGKERDRDASLRGHAVELGQQNCDKNRPRRVENLFLAWWVGVVAN